MIKATEPTLEFYAQQIDFLLNKATSEPESRLHWVTLGSVNTSETGNEPDLRMVVLRRVDTERNLLFYTDSRSPKIEQFKANTKASVLLFDPTSMMQLRIYGEVSVDTQSEECLKAIDDLSEHSRINYTTLEAPGAISSSKGIPYDVQKVHFGLLKFHSTKFDLLHLRREGALRIQANNAADQQLSQLRWVTP
ncbi:MAG: pyridoxamine 5'-phosphate oxidase family protein [Bacteroidetes bacterium]|nr:pyridoxamine 5'-phosphate oxidase family protein [Bacteroidota bacterium]MDA0950214.1 pyridoxamine 5'-phosphate oxidase family protein [Bacteroidota bacterium]